MIFAPADPRARGVQFNLKGLPERAYLIELIPARGRDSADMTATFLYIKSRLLYFRADLN